MTLEQQLKQQNILTTAHNDYQKDLNAHAFFKLHNKTLGQDLVQDTFIKTWGYLVKGGKIEMMRAFLYHVLNHLIIDEYRKKKSVSLDVLVERGYEPSVDDTEKTIDILDGKNAVELIDRIPFKYQKIMRMKYIQNLTLKEMSLITGQSKNTVAVQVHRGLEKLKEVYNRNQQV